MLKFLPSPIRGSIALFLYATNLAMWTIILFLTAIIHAVIPVKNFQKKAYHLMQQLPVYWIGGNDLILKLTTNIHWKIEGLEQLSKEEWYFLVANHQSWIDILVLQKVFNRKIPTLKFFLKKPLIWLPFAGQACWLLDFPFMERAGKSFLKKNPHIKGKDIETTQIACEKFKRSPATLINFLEGTRFRAIKKQHQKSPYQYLLKPKSSGLATAISVLENYANTLIDVTIVYPDAPIHAWDFFCGRTKTIIVEVRALTLPTQFRSNFLADRGLRAEFQQWINEVWKEKDNRMKEMMANE